MTNNQAYASQAVAQETVEFIDAAQEALAPLAYAVGKLDREFSTRAQADTEETAARIQGDLTEASVREEALAAESEARATADTSLQQQVNSLDGVVRSIVSPNSGVAAGSYGQSANSSPAHSASFSVPAFTVNAQGKLTAANTRTVTLPAAPVSYCSYCGYCSYCAQCDYNCHCR